MTPIQREQDYLICQTNDLKGWEIFLGFTRLSWHATEQAAKRQVKIYAQI